MDAAELIQPIVAGEINPNEVDIDALAVACEHLNAEYRAGRPVVSDRVYDELFQGVLAARAPDHPFVSQVEPEAEGQFGGAGKVVHKKPMLSTSKIYTDEELGRFFLRVERAASDIGISRGDIQYRVTPKLDGIAGFDDGEVLASRGNGEVGSDLTFGIGRGVRMMGGRGLGAGEIVVLQRYFEDVLEPQFELDHPRNFVAGLFAADEAKPHHIAACENGAVQFVPYSTLGSWVGSADRFKADWRSIMDAIRSNCPFLTDGVILEVDSVLGRSDGADELRSAMGSTSSFHRWMTAIKSQGDTALTTVISVRAQTGRSGRVTPVLNVEAVRLDGATITSVTAHTVASVKRLGLGVGAECRITRSGGVIPKLLEVTKPAAEVAEIDECPSCGHVLVEDGEYAVCVNHACPAQMEGKINHWFGTLGNADLFGPATAAKLVAAGCQDLLAVYAVTESALIDMGFGPGQAANLLAELQRSRTEEIPDWRWLAAAGIRHLGRGDSRRLLAAYSLEDVLDGLEPEQIAAVEGFGPITSPLISASLREQGKYLRSLLSLGFTLKRSVGGPSGADAGSAVSGKRVVFTGAMTTGSRGEMQERARELGAEVQSSVNGKTDFLVTGERVGAKKIEAAQKWVEKGSLTILDEQGWLSLLQQAA